MDVQAWKSSGRAIFRGFRGGCVGFYLIEQGGSGV